MFEAEQDGIEIQDEKVLTDADDIAILVETEEILEIAVSEMGRTLKHYNVKINANNKQRFWEAEHQRKKQVLFSTATVEKKWKIFSSSEIM